MNKIALITGATAGFGEAIANIFAKNNFDLIITGRRTERLEKLKTSLESEFQVKVLTLSFDVRDQSAVKSNLNSLPKEWKSIDALINNAGLASGLNHIQDGDIEDWDRMIDTNVKGLLYVSKSIIPLMIERKKGHIINIGSTAGKEVYENGNVYCASKHAVDAISKGMRIDLLGTGIKVTQIAPGAAETEFSLVRFHGDEARAKAAYNGYQPMTPNDIAEQVYYVTTLPENLCINDMVITSLAQANSYYINREN
ncbi:SDR family NAD(P)-dependent oxidoreductase [Salibacteraceae bacterium]|jgi:3-hydroxy acid dehydrogenase / malonic semialdehyde reductase|nr:SDR family NAD(P)-dependent oxidoreductase [Salibacteraceae bacterium]MDB9710088.1 SDR family NAD(P)-dependent oxidoreductase [Salibacteraceae bacterium]MDC1304063.1 SDR family NAD(P)-dependent oxidoreductase [Salibacteraceae bacterium]